MSNTEQQLLTIEIDGKQLQVPSGTSIIKAADDAGIHIPRFCYHKKLSVAANCRMCLVEMEGGRKPTPACSTPAADGMKVFTKSKKALAYQKAVMEFLLINHPLDCPICDQGGECELQDTAMGYGGDVSRYNQGKRAVEDKDIGPLVATDLTRCIQCTRCVRFGEEISGMQELGMINRGEFSEIDLFLRGNIDSEVSANVIDLCPVGALTNKPFRYRARAWEMSQKPQISPHDCVGSNMYGHVRRGDLMRVVPRENESINQTWIADRDRFSHFGLESEERLTQPMIKRDGEWEVITWETAMELLQTRMQKVLNGEGAKQVGALASPSATTEELYLLQKLMRGLGSPHIDHRLHQQDFEHDNSWGSYPGLDCELADVEAADHVLLVGSNLRKEQPLVHLRLRQASLHGAQVSVVNPADFALHCEVNHQAVAAPDEMVATIAALAKAVVGTKTSSAFDGFKALVKDIKVSAAVKAMASQLKKAANPVVLSGQLVEAHPQASQLLALLDVIKQKLAAKGGQLTRGANSAGAWLAGAVPHRGPGGKTTDGGRHAGSMLTGRPLKLTMLLNVEPEFDSAYGQAALAQLQKSDYVVSLNTFFGAGTREYADLVLPIAAYSETSGTYVNASGQWQSFAGAATPAGESRPAWKVLRVIANFLEVPGFDYTTSEDVLAECRSHINETCVGLQNIVPLKSLAPAGDGLVRIGITPIYAVDAIVRRSVPLQATEDAQVVATIHSKVAKKLGVAHGDQVTVSQGKITVTVPVSVSGDVAERAVVLPIGVSQTLPLTQAFGMVQLSKVKA